MTRIVLSCLFACCLTIPALGQDAQAETACEKTERVVQEAVDARRAGDSKRKTRRMLIDVLDRTAGEQLAEYIYSLPEAQLTDEVAALFKTQCEAL